jgi:general stress protein 13
LYEVGSIITGKIDALSTFGAFVLLEDNSRGMVHISEVKKGFIKDIKDILKVGDEIEVKVLKFNKERGKYDLSMKQATKEIEKVEKQTGPPDFEHKMNLFMKKSEDRQVDIRRRMKSKQGIRNKSY